MAKCEVCGIEYYPSFEVVAAGQRHVFDCFECAIHELAPVCAHCGCKVIGHGVEANTTYFCCAHCARASGVTGVADRAWFTSADDETFHVQGSSNGYLGGRRSRVG